MTPTLHAICLFAGVASMSFLFAKVEIHIEGDKGWAASLPTWRIEKHWLLDLFFGGRTLTGYHAWMLSFMLAAFHFPALVLGDWSWRYEALVMAAFIVFWILEDLLWFLLNPAWGWRRFDRVNVTWHRYWLLWFPTDYWIFTVVAAGLGWFALRPAG
ncbi:MAG: hypothetical protein H0V44_17375 [Planctomycetes bacterium]|nr:hypothetical protein [Planctomycetota bacterium]